MSLYKFDLFIIRIRILNKVVNKRFVICLSILLYITTHTCTGLPKLSNDQQKVNTFPLRESGIPLITYLTKNFLSYFENTFLWLINLSSSLSSIPFKLSASLSYQMIQGFSLVEETLSTDSAIEPTWTSLSESESLSNEFCDFVLGIIVVLSVILYV